MSKKRIRILQELAGVMLGAAILGLAVRGCVAEPLRVPSGSMAPTLVAGDVVVVNKLVYGLRLPFTGRRLLARRAPMRGEVIVFNSPREPREQVVRRVVGLPGDVVEIRSGTVWVNGVPQPRTPAGRISYLERNESTGLWWTDTCLLFSETLAKGALAPPTGGESQPWAAGAQNLTTHDTLQCRRDHPPEREGPFLTVAPGHVFVLGDNRDRSTDSRSDGGWQVPFEKISGKAAFVAWSWGGTASSAPRGARLRFDRLFKPIK